jgi:hypothetical protein
VSLDVPVGVTAGPGVGKVGVSAVRFKRGEESVVESRADGGEGSIVESGADGGAKGDEETLRVR